MFIEKKRLAHYFGVAFPEEGAELRRAGIRKPIHVFTIAAASQLKLYPEFGLEPTVCSSEQVEQFDRLGKRLKTKIPVHLKIETGMNRIGVQKNSWKEIVGALARAGRIELQGVFTHFATSGDKDQSFARRQLQEFTEAVDLFRRAGIEPREIHCANSGAILDLPESYCSMVRPGIMMYGYYPSRTTSESVVLKPALSLKTQVSMVKKIGAGESVSYGRRYIAAKSTTIATIPIGYADGLFRTLTNRMNVLIGGASFPVVGTICMDQCMVDCGSTDVHAGDEVVVVGSQRGRKQTAWQLSETVGTSPYELLCAVAARVPRIYRTV